MPKLMIGIFGQLKPEMIEAVISGLQTAKRNHAEAQKADPKAPEPEIFVPIASSGGDIGTAFAIHNFLASSPFKVVTHNVGEVVSAANVVFLAGKERLATEHSFFKFHGVTWTFATSGPLSKSLIEDANISIEQYQKMMTRVFKETTKMTNDEIAAIFHRTVCFDPAGAAARGIIHAVRAV